MLKHLARRRIKPLVLGIDWQIDSLRIVLLGGANTTNHQGQQQLLGQWLPVCWGMRAYTLTWACPIGYAVGCTALQDYLKALPI